MKTIIAGSRTIRRYKIVEEAIEKSGFEITEIISGCARGPDTFGEEWAHRNNVSVKKFPANWNKHGKAAGLIRNREMLNHAEALIAVWDGKSRGTKDMIEIAKNKGIKVYTELVPTHGDY